MQRAVPLVATVVSGLLYASAFPSTNWHLLAWVALVPWFVAVHRGSAMRAILLAWLWSLVSAYTLNDWFPRAVHVYYLQPAWVGAAFFLAVTSLTAAPAFALFALAWRRISVRRVYTPLAGAAAWVGCELLRSRLLGDPWALLGYAETRVPALLQLAEVTGVYGTSFVVAAVNCALAQLYLAHPIGAPARRAARRGSLIALGIVAAAGVYGIVRLRQLDAADAAGVPIAVVQPNLDLGSQWHSELYGRNLDAYLRLTRAALQDDPTPRLIVWPESALSFFLDDEPLYRTVIARVLSGAGAELVAGGPRTANGKEPPFHNTTFLLRSDGEIAAWYDKRDLLPFAERFPWQSAELLHRRFGRVREFTPGGPSPPLPTVAGAAGVIVCNEALFAEPARSRVKEGATLLLALANDTWVDSAKYAEQAAAMALVRAVEQRRALVRASTAGPSLIVAPSGRVTARTEAFSAATLAGSVAARTDETPYARAGDLFAWLCAAAALAAALSRDACR